MNGAGEQPSRTAKQAILQMNMMRDSAGQMAENKCGLLNLRGLCLAGRFEITRRIGCGSYAEIYLARNVAPRQGEPEIVALKALNPFLQGLIEPSLERTLVENIEFEAQTLAHFRHDNIIRMFAHGEALDYDGTHFYYLILEYVSGVSLAQLCRMQPLSFEKMLDYTGQICSALAYAHARKVLHRDIKPNNIMVSADGRTVRLLDFGTARLLDNAASLITKVGTDLYAAPEHYSLHDATNDQLTYSADVYALAKTIYYMLCGESPAAFTQRPISSLPPYIMQNSWAEGLQRILLKATSTERPNRYQTVQEFYDALSAILELTIHLPRHGSDVTSEGRSTNSRIVVGINPKILRDSSKVVKSYHHLLAAYLSSCATFVALSYLAACRWTRQSLRSVYVVSSGICRSLWQRSLTVRIGAVILATLILLLATPYILRWLRLQTPTVPPEQGTEAISGYDAIASTDINIRSGPQSNMPKIGLAERGSRLRVLSCQDSQKWCEIKVIQHGREKQMETSSDRGWVSRKYLIFN